jgi:hypothetical protein
VDGLRCREAPPAPHDLQVEEAAPHWHLWILGFELTLPISPESAGDEPEQPWIVASVGGDGAAAPGLAHGPAPAAAARCQAAACSAAALADHPSPRAGPQVLSAPLCDTARFERSGVQLI